LIPRIRRPFRNQVIVTDSDARSANTIVFAGKGDILTKAPWPPRPQPVQQVSRYFDGATREAPSPRCEDHTSTTKRCANPQLSLQNKSLLTD
jgi:hypothetical protein